MKSTASFSLAFVLIVVLQFHASPAHGAYDYADALNKTIYFFEQQRAGKLPSNQRATWRGDSALSDGADVGLDLSGGYYDAGDNVKFGWPMSYSITMMAWGAIEFYSQLQQTDQLVWTLDAIKWGTDFFINAHPGPNTLYVQVGDGDSDHSCWQRPEEMTTDRTAYKIDEEHPGSEIAAQVSAAMAASSLAFLPIDPAYSATLLTHARQLFTFADTYKGSFIDAFPDAGKYYYSYSGYEDELVWAAAWLYRATLDQSYMDYLVAAGGPPYGTNMLGVDNANAALEVILGNLYLQGSVTPESAPVLHQYNEKALDFVCSVMGVPTRTGWPVHKTPGGMLYYLDWSNFHYVGSALLTVSVYSDYVRKAGGSINCISVTLTPDDLDALVKQQVDYMLGSNPLGISFLIGFGPNSPTHPHHRGASIPSIHVMPTHLTCGQGFLPYLGSPDPAPNLLIGALMGGPDANDNYQDLKTNFQQNEPTTYNNAPLVGTLARLAGGYRPSSLGLWGATEFLSLHPSSPTSPASDPVETPLPSPPAASPSPEQQPPVVPPPLEPRPPASSPPAASPQPAPDVPSGDAFPPPPPSVAAPENSPPPPADSPPAPVSDSGFPIIVNTPYLTLTTNPTGQAYGDILEYSVLVFNHHTQKIGNIAFAATNFRATSYWNLLVGADGLLRLPEWAPFIWPNEGGGFGYFQSGGPANITVVSADPM